MLPPLLLAVLAWSLSAAETLADEEPSCEGEWQDMVHFMQLHKHSHTHTHQRALYNSTRLPANRQGSSGPNHSGPTLNEAVARGFDARGPWEYVGWNALARADIYSASFGVEAASSAASLPKLAFVLVLSGMLLLGVFMWAFLPKPQGTAGAQLSWHHVMLLMQLDFIQPFSQDSYLPSLPTMVQDLGTTENMVALTLQVNWFTSGVVCLALGMGADSFGRRPMLLLGMVCYIIGALCAGYAPSVEYLIAGRILQGIGEGTNVLCYTIARDTIQDPEERAKLFSMFAVVATSAITLAPVVGGIVATWFGWRMVFVMLSCWGTTIFFHAVTCLPETHPNLQIEERQVEISPKDRPATPSGEPQESPWKIVGAVFMQSCEPWALFLTLWIMGPLMMGILSNTPFILNMLSESAGELGISMVMALYACFALLGGGAAMVLLHFVDSWETLHLMMSALLATGAVFCVFGTAFTPSLQAFVALSTLFIFTQSIMQGPLRSRIAEPFGEVAGTAMGLANGLNGPLAAVFGFGLTRALESGGVQAWDLALGIMMLVQQACWWPLLGFSRLGARTAHKANPKPGKDGGKEAGKGAGEASDNSEI